MFNNDVTYDIKWETDDNKRALLELERKFFPRSECWPSCPTAWAPEVLELLNHLDDEFGIRRNTTTISSIYVKDSWLQDLTINPFLEAHKEFNRAFLLKDLRSYEQKYYDGKSLLFKLSSVGRAFMRSYQMGATSFKIRVINRVLNATLNPKISLDQIKEKYGHLNVYYGAPDYLSEYIDNEVRKTELKIAAKGAYYPIENFYSHAVSTYSEVCDLEVKISRTDEKTEQSVTRYPYRRLMKDMGINLEEIESKAESKE